MGRKVDGNLMCESGNEVEKKSYYPMENLSGKEIGTKIVTESRKENGKESKKDVKWKMGRKLVGMCIV